MARLNAMTKSSGFRILLVEDDDLLLATTLRVLQRQGHETTGVARPGEALEALHAWRPDLVLLDYHLEKTTGPELLDSMRLIDRHVPVILVTGYAGELGPRALLARLDIQGFHDKSEGTDRLLTLIDTTLKNAAILTSLEAKLARLRGVAEATARLHELASRSAVAMVALSQLRGVLGGEPEGALLLVDDGDGDGPRSVAASGCLESMAAGAALDPSLVAAARAGCDAPLAVFLDGRVLIPLRGARLRACIVTQATGLTDEALEAVAVFERHVVVALERAAPRKEGADVACR